MELLSCESTVSGDLALRLCAWVGHVSLHGKNTGTTPVELQGTWKTGSESMLVYETLAAGREQVLLSKHESAAPSRFTLGDGTHLELAAERWLQAEAQP